MKHTISYTLEFFSFWHCGSGLAAGADLDSLVIKDSQGLPFIPGKTMKGLVRQAAEEIADLQSRTIDSGRLFGKEVSEKAETFFTDAVLVDHDTIVNEKLGKYLFQSISSTRIDDDGIARKGSLRKIQVVIPCKLEGKIIGVEMDDRDLFTKALSYIKAIGLKRTRGFGRCKITVTEAS